MKKLTAISIFALLLLTATFTTHADEIPYYFPFSILSEDETRIFFYNPGERSYWYGLYDPDDFPATGLYYNTDPPTPIYLVENRYSHLRLPPWHGEYIFSSDMYYFVTIPQMNLNMHSVGQATALVFYKHGAIVREYTIGELVRIPFLIRRSVSMAQWIDRDSITFDPATNSLTLTTSERITYIFDITTGEIISRRVPLHIWLIRTAIIGSIIGITFILAKHIYKKRRNKKCKIQQSQSKWKAAE